jgi:hypothetical protein
MTGARHIGVVVLEQQALLQGQSRGDTIRRKEINRGSCSRGIEECGDKNSDSQATRDRSDGSVNSVLAIQSTNYQLSGIAVSRSVVEGP